MLQLNVWFFPNLDKAKCSVRGTESSKSSGTENSCSQSTERWMRCFLINKNLCLYYWLKTRIGKKGAFRVANTIEKIVLIFGREQM
jgi:hypothetical protein